MGTCESVLEEHDVPGPKERYEAADSALQILQPAAFKELVGETPTRFSNLEAILVASEVAIDYRDMNRLILENPDYHIPKTYVDLLVSGQLSTVHVRVMDADGSRGDFRTASCIPSNHIGAPRAASEASQQMRLLTEGRGVAMSAYATDVLASMCAARPDGYGLRFRLGKPAEVVPGLVELEVAVPRSRPAVW